MVGLAFLKKAYLKSLHFKVLLSYTSSDLFSSFTSLHQYMEFYNYYFCCSIILRESIITKVCTLRVLFTAPTFNSKSIAFVDEKFILYSYYLFRQNLRLCLKFLKLTASLTQPLSSSVQCFSSFAF